MTESQQSKVGPPRFPQTWCSQCGIECGPGDNGYSDCKAHRNAAKEKRESVAVEAEEKGRAA